MVGAICYNCEIEIDRVSDWFKSHGVFMNYLIIDNPNDWNIKVSENILTVSMFRAVEYYKQGKIDKIIINTANDMDCAMHDRLLVTRLGVDPSDILYVPIELYNQNVPEEDELITDENLKYVQHLEFHVTHRCNFNCGGCNHFVPLIPDSEEIDFDTMIKDWKELRKKITHISDVSILGGEPFLCDRLVDYCREFRKLWPYAGVAIYTNGALIKKVDPADLAEIGRLNIMIRISAYTSVAGIYEDIIDYCRGKNVACTYEIKPGFYPPLHESEEKKFFSKNTEMCKWLTVENGRLYPCPMITYIKHYNNYFGENFPEEKGLDLYNENLTLQDINKYCSSIHNLCNYCNEYPERGRNAGLLTNPQIVFGKKEEAKKEYWVNDCGSCTKCKK